MCESLCSRPKNSETKFTNWVYLEAAQLIRRQYKGWIHLQQKLLYIAVEFDRWRFSLRLSLKTNISNR